MLEISAHQIVAQERLQLIANGLSPAEEDGYEEGELAQAAERYRDAEGPGAPRPWDWCLDEDDWKPAHRLTNLARAVALYQAEVDRLTRLLAAAHYGGQVCIEELESAIQVSRDARGTCTICGREIPADETRAGFTECEHCASPVPEGEA